MMPRALIALTLATIACEPAVPDTVVPETVVLEDGDGLARTFTRGTSGLRMYAVGDSYFDWNTGNDTPEVVYRELNATGFNASEAGALFLDGQQGIPAQYQDRNSDWVLMTGGGNDLQDTCGCGNCNRTMNRLITRAPGGEMASFVRDRLAEGNRVAIVGYLPLLPQRQDFLGCDDELAEMVSRFNDVVDGNRVLYIDPADVTTPGDLSMYAPDLIHPSRRGSRIIGEYVAQRIMDVL